MTSPAIVVRSRSGAYGVVVSRGSRTRLPEILADAGLPQTVVTVSSRRVWTAQGRFVARRTPILVADGERAKTLGSVSRLYDAFVDARVDRGSTIVAVGGGVIGDMVGFAAATYLRGIRLVHVPTTVMAQVDSAIGGKVGVNHPRGKNLIGAFHPPALVVVDPDALTTLSRREFRAGLYEVIKYGAIGDDTLLDRLNGALPDILTQRGDALAGLIDSCCQAKAAVVSADEHELGLRRTLNFGHTVGHALEAVTGFRRLRHGEAVALGMRAALSIGVARGVTPAGLASRVSALIDRLGRLPSVGDVRASDVVTSVRRDKKVVNGTLHFVLATGRGATTTVTDVTARELRAALIPLGIRPR